MARLAFGVLALLALAGTARAAQLRVLNEAEHPAFNYIYATNIYNPEDVIQEKFLSFEPDSVNECAALCNRTIGAMCKSWTFCWSSGRCATMAKAPASTTVRADGKSTYTPKCASGIKRGVPARNPAAEEDYITLRYGNECNMPIIAAVHFKNLDGDWVTNGWFALAPGQTKDVARTRNTVFYSYANEKGDPRCTRGCWDGMDTIEKFDGRTWGFREQAVSEDTELGDSYRLAFTCDNTGAAAAAPNGAVITSTAADAAAPAGAVAADGSVTPAPEDGAAPVAAPNAVSYVRPNGVAPNLRPIEPAPNAVFIREFGLAPRGGAASDGADDSEAGADEGADEEVVSLGGPPASVAEGEDEEDDAEDSTTIVLGSTTAAPAATAAAPAATAAAPAATTAAAPAAPASNAAVLDAAAAARALTAPVAAVNATAPATAPAPVLTAETAPAAGAAVSVNVNGTGVAVGVGAGGAAEESKPADEFAAEPKRR